MVDDYSGKQPRLQHSKMNERLEVLKGCTMNVLTKPLYYEVLTTPLLSFLQRMLLQLASFISTEASILAGIDTDSWRAISSSSSTSVLELAFGK